MDTYLIWLLAGFLLMIVELISGTFVLLMLGIAAFAGSLMAWLGFGLWPQALVAVIVAMLGLVWVWKRPRRDGPPMASLDLGQAVTVDKWVDREAGRARVRYRDTLWDARIEGTTDVDTYYITAVEGNTLRVSAASRA
jgi:membrane protein implicated in regulation of membrane protease activity